MSTFLSVTSRLLMCLFVGACSATRSASSDLAAPSLNDASVDAPGIDSGKCCWDPQCPPPSQDAVGCAYNVAMPACACATVGYGCRYDFFEETFSLTCGCDHYYHCASYTWCGAGSNCGCPDGSIPTCNDGGT